MLVHKAQLRRRTSCRMLAAAAAAGSGEVAAELAAPPLPRPTAERGDVSALVPDSSRLSRGTPGEGTAAAALTCGSMTPKDRDVPAGEDTCQQGTTNPQQERNHHCIVVCDCADHTHFVVVPDRYLGCVSVTACRSWIFTKRCSHAVLRSEHTDLCAARQAAAAGRRASSTRPQVRGRRWGVRRERGLPEMGKRPLQS
jgi:hypothetical protein